MGGGASCTASPSTPPDERLRTMLILRAYNCRPRDWTMRDQFDSFAENGILTKNRLREALRLSECPRIGALLDRVLRDNPVTGDESSTGSSISVAALISFVEAGGASNMRASQIPRPAVEGHSSNQPPPLQSAMPACKLSEEMHKAACPLATESPPRYSAPPRKAFDASVNGAGVELLLRVVPLTPKWALAPPTAADRKGSGNAISATSRGREEHSSSSTGDNSPGALRGAGEDSPGALEIVDCSRQDETGDIGCQPGSKHAFGHCKTLVRHLGSILRLRGKEACRRSGPVQPVWRKKETLIQERIVQYTTLDEEGMVQELLETEKSQTDVLHMECKRTGEFAHRESTHYESGEAFNGEVVVEESGVEHYVHLRSVDDEYEHLESTLPPRARQGAAAAAGAETAGDGAPGACEDGTSVNAGGREAGQRAEASGSSSDDPGAVERGHGGDEGTNDGIRKSGPINSKDQCEERQAYYPGVGEHSRPSESSPAPQSTSPQTGSSRHGHEDTAGARRNGNATAEVSGVGAGGRRHPSPSPPSPSYHYRSPSCSPRLSPRPARSPYRQEGVGGRESSGRGERRRWHAREEQQHQEDVPARGVGLSAADDTEAGRGRSVGGTYCSAGEENGKGGESGGFVEERGDEGGAARRWGTGFCAADVPPVSAPVPRSYLEETDGVTEAQSKGGVNGEVRSDFWCNANKPAGTESGFRPPWDSTPPGTARPVFDGGGDVNGEGSFDLGENQCGSVVFLDIDSGKGGNGENTGADGKDWGEAESGSVPKDLPIFGGDGVASVFNSSGDKADWPSHIAAERPTNGTSPRPSTSRGFTPSTAENSNSATKVPYIIRESSSNRPDSNGVDSNAPLATSALEGDGSKGRRWVGDSDMSEVGANNEEGREVMHGAEKATAPLPGHAPFHSYVWDRITSSSRDVVDGTGECSFTGGAMVDDSNQFPGHGVVV